VIVLFDLLTAALLIATALLIARTRDLGGAVVMYAMYGLLLSLFWVRRGAPDVALTEAALGAGVTTVLFLATIARTTRRETR
jgi:uncharacterized MnhB-related membrane protein